MVSRRSNGGKLLEYQWRVHCKRWHTIGGPVKKVFALRSGLNVYLLQVLSTLVITISIVSGWILRFLLQKIFKFVYNNLSFIIWRQLLHVILIKAICIDAKNDSHHLEVFLPSSLKSRCDRVGCRSKNKP